MELLFLSFFVFFFFLLNYWKGAMKQKKMVDPSASVTEQLPTLQI